MLAVVVTRGRPDQLESFAAQVALDQRIGEESGVGLSALEVGVHGFSEWPQSLGEPFLLAAEGEQRGRREWSAPRIPFVLQGPVNPGDRLSRGPRGTLKTGKDTTLHGGAIGCGGEGSPGNPDSVGPAGSGTKKVEQHHNGLLGEGGSLVGGELGEGGSGSTSPPLSASACLRRSERYLERTSKSSSSGPGSGMPWRW